MTPRFPLALPEHVSRVDTLADGALLLVCRSPRHSTPRDYVARSGAGGRRCPLCLALVSLADHRPSPEAA